MTKEQSFSEFGKAAHSVLAVLVHRRPEAESETYIRILEWAEAALANLEANLQAAEQPNPNEP